MASEVQAKPKWEGKTSAELKSSPAQQVWPFLADFCNLHKVFPGLETCYQVEGVPGQPGLIRCCAGLASNNDESTVMWAKEKLIAVDPIKRCFSYQMLENNKGYKSYVATMQVVPVINDDEGCMIEWSFVSDPVEGWGLEEFQSYRESSLQGMAKKIEDALQPSTSATV
ncbi:putative polyketide cyclase/dehydrase, START-like domain-containing protein [Rosa chinensis]|uniref:Putative polyketide cyclase/dehydrase, START-like domain-containing protein n=1 Tax=Rosa chinensis TaxID=74649 RepID=A0A2P6Q041_ROSCH|nr:lachrymatory-factor synthase [Rosa chinensis]PRQ27551.1 putative polyketide cyclase/dehydrase, START-like domain-containing protein [Rosa chinensis]